MNLPEIDPSKVNEESVFGEYYRLSNELRPTPERQVVIDGKTITIPAKEGINIQTCTEKQLRTWIANVILNKIKSSKSSLAFLLRIYAKRFPTEFISFKRNIAPDWLKLELELIESEVSDDIEYFAGMVGYYGLIELNDNYKNRLNPDTIIHKDNNGKIWHKNRQI